MAITEVTNHDYNGTDTNQQKKEYQRLNTDSQIDWLTEENNGSTCLVLDYETEQVEFIETYHHPQWYEV